MKSFFRFFATNNKFATLLTLAFLVLGAISLQDIQRDTFPEVDFGSMVITTRYAGASPEDVELKVTNKIENELKSISGIEKYTSWSMENFSMISVVVHPDEDSPDDVKDEIREAVARVTDLPREVTESPLVTEMNSSAVFSIIEVGIAGDVPYDDLRDMARQLEKKLENVPGISKLQRYGYRAREIEIEVKPEEMRRNNVAMAEVIQAIQSRNIRSSGGSFESYTSEKNIVTLAQFRDPMEVGDVIVRTTFDGPMIKVSDLAEIKDDFEDERVRSRMNGKNAISFIAYKNINADIIRTVDAIKALVEEEKELLADNIEIFYANDSSKYVENRFEIVSTNGLIGLALLLLTLTIFLNLRMAFWVAMGIPVALFGVVFLLPSFGVFLDSITLTAMVLVIGIIVDDAIIIAESIYQRYEDGLSPIEAAVEGINDVIKPVITTILTTLVVFIPMFFLPGMMGKFVFVIPLVMILALSVSLLESTVALPAHLAEGLKKKKRSNKVDIRQRVFNKLRGFYKRFMLGVLRFRYLMVILFAAVLAGSMTFAYKYMDIVMFPSSTADRFSLLVQLPTGSSLQATSDKIKEIENIVSALDKSELDSYVTRIGTYGDVIPSEVENYAAVNVFLTPYATRERNADQIVESLREKTNLLAGFHDIKYKIDAGGPPVGAPISLRVVSSDDINRVRLADDIVAYLKTIEGVKDIDRDDKTGKQQIEIQLNYSKLARSGLTVSDVAQNVRVAYDGQIVTNVRYGEEDVNFRVIFQENARKNPEYLNQLSIPNNRGRLIPLKQVSSYETGPGPSNYFHYKGERTITITGDIDKDIVTSIQATQAVLDQFNVNHDYPGTQLIVDGEAQETQDSMKDMAIISLIAIVGVYFLLVLLFDSIWQPLMVIVALPFAITSVIIAFALHNEPLGFLAMTGLIGLAGVVVNDSLVLVNHTNELLKKHLGEPVREIIAHAASNRLRAIILTTITTVAGLMPLAYGLGGSDPYMSPMALALGYGLFFATPLTLVLLPCLYLIGQDLRTLFAKKQTSNNQIDRKAMEAGEVS